MNEKLIYFTNMLITLMIHTVIGILTAAVAGTVGYLIWQFVMRKTEKYYIKNAMNFLRLVLICLIAPIVFFVAAIFIGMAWDCQIVNTNLRMCYLIIPVVGLWFYRMRPALWECIQRYVTIHRLCSQNMPVRSENCYAMLKKWKKKLKLRKRIKVYDNVYITSPAIVYHWGYKLLLPAQGLQEDELNIAILHELVHCKHHDLLVKNIALAANVFHCFHPVCFRLRKDIDRWAEVDCDFDCCENGKEEFTHRDYFQCILRLKARSMGKSLDDGKPDKPLCNLYDDSSILQFRLEMMHRMNKDYVRIPIASFMLTTVLAFVLTVGAWNIAVAGVNHWYKQTLTYERIETSELQQTTDIIVCGTEEEGTWIEQFAFPNRQDEERHIDLLMDIWK
ncbi:MAG: hypothetical protein NC124_03005 [Clostridium sp.]|nr:hypothetical protein [Clostridium sp.]